MKIFNSVSDLQAASLTAGQLTQTKRYYAGQDGGGATYLIKTAVDFGGTPDEYGDHTLANGNVAVLQYDESTPVEKWGLFANGTDMSAALAAVEAAKEVLIFSSDGTYVFDSPVETTRSHLVLMTTPKVKIRVNSADGWFNVNHSPFQLHGSGNEISHVSRILFNGNDPALLLKDFHLWDFYCTRDDVVSDKSPFYFPNSATENLSVRNVSANDAITPANRCVNSEFIQVEMGTTAGTKNISLKDIDVFGYKGSFGIYGTEYCYGFSAENVYSQSATGQGFRNYHCYYSHLKNVRVNNNGEPAYAWLGFGVSADLRADDSQTGGWTIEQANCDVTVSGRGCDPWLANPTWGLSNCSITINSYDNGYACELNPQGNVAATSDMDNVTIYLNSANDAYGALNIDNANTNHNWRQVDIHPNILGTGAGNAIRGRNIIDGTSIRLHGGVISGYAGIWDVRIAAGVGNLYIQADGTNLEYTGSSPLRNDCNAGLSQLFNCKVKNTANLTAWSALGTFNRFDNCFDKNTNTVLSG